MFSKKDLKTGMIIENRKGKKAMILLGTKNGDIYSGKDMWGPLINFHDDLTSITAPSCDIIKIYQPCNNSGYLSSSTFSYAGDLIVDLSKTGKLQEKINNVSESLKENNSDVTVIIDKNGYKILLPS